MYGSTLENYVLFDKKVRFHIYGGRYRLFYPIKKYNIRDTVKKIRLKMVKYPKYAVFF